MYSAQQAFNSGNLGRARELLETRWPAPGQRDLRGFEWHYLSQLCHGDNIHTFYGHPNGVRCLAFSLDGLLLASGDSGSSVRLWDVKSRRLLTVLPAHKNTVHCIGRRTVLRARKGDLFRVLIDVSHGGHRPASIVICGKVSPEQSLVGKRPHETVRSSEKCTHLRDIDARSTRSVRRISEGGQRFSQIATYSKFDRDLIVRSRFD